MSVLIGQNRSIFADPINRRLVVGVLFSLLLHALVLSMQFGIPGLGVPGLELPWKERRVNVQPPITIQIANADAQIPAQTQAQPVAMPAKPSPPIEVPSPALVSPPPVIPLLKSTPTVVANTGIRLQDPVTPSKPVSVLKKIITKKQKQITPSAPPPSRLARPAVELADTPARVIAQEKIRDDNFVVPVSEPEEPIQKSNANKSTKENARLTSAETFDQTELSEEELAKSVELAIAKEVEKDNAEKEKAEILLKQVHKLAEEKQKQQAVKQMEEAIKQQEIALAAQTKLESEEQVKRLQKQETMRLEAQRKVQQLEQELAARKKIEMQEKLQAQQKQLEEQAVKQKTEQLAARLKAEELAEQKAAAQKIAEQKIAEQKIAEQKLVEQKLAEQKLAEQKLAEQKLAEQKLAEQKIAEQKLAEQKLAEQKLAEQKLAEQKLAEQKLAEQKLAEQKLAEQKLAEQKLAEQKLAEQKLAEQRAAEQRASAQRERALADAALASKANVAGLSTNANGGASAGVGAAGTNLVLPRNNFSSDLANRAREQSKGWDVLSGAPPAPRQTGPDLNSRRRSILGNFDREVPVRMYVESWRQKVERNGNFNYSQSSKDKARGDPVVIVAIRSDGSVEDVTIVRSSGRADLDEAVSRIVRLNAPYAVFPQNIAAKYDVIEIRRVWQFGETLRILEEVR